jgi:hypothetical protein
MFLLLVKDHIGTLIVCPINLSTWNFLVWAKAKHLISLGFVPGDNKTTFSFIDPAQVIHSVHFIPAFAWGYTTKYILQKFVIALGTKESDNNWQSYNVAM